MPSTRHTVHSINASAPPSPTLDRHRADDLFPRDGFLSR